MDFINNLNYELGNLIGLTLFDPQHSISLVIRLVINLIVVSIIARYLYYPRSSCDCRWQEHRLKHIEDYGLRQCPQSGKW